MKNKINIAELTLFENDDYLVLNKPPHISTLDERTEGAPLGLLRVVRQLLPDAQVAHRLDKGTSGAIAFAKNPDAYRNLAMQFEHRQVTKVYHAVVGGLQDFVGINVFLPIMPQKNGTVKIDKINGKEAETIFNTIEVFKAHTLVECLPITGRMHQIRIHLSCLNAPIVMDETYGGKPIFLSQIKPNFNLKNDTDELPLISRVALHARALSFMLRPNDEESRIMIEAPYPKDMAALLNQLRKNN